MAAKTPKADRLARKPSPELQETIDRVLEHARAQARWNPDVAPEDLAAFELFDVDGEESSIEVRATAASEDAELIVHRLEEEEG